MTNVATLRVTPAPGSPTKLKQVFTAAMGFSASQLSSQREAIKSSAQAEGASDDMLWTDDAGLTSGMIADCIQPAAQALDAWTTSSSGVRYRAAAIHSKDRCTRHAR